MTADNTRTERQGWLSTHSGPSKEKKHVFRKTNKQYLGKVIFLTYNTIHADLARCTLMSK